MDVKKIEWEKINKILLGIFLILLGWFLLDILLRLGKTREIVPFFQERGEVISSIDELKPVPSFEKYERAVKKRRLFKGTLPERPVATGTISLDTRLSPSDFQLLGIVGGINPQAIILNKKTNQTYFLYRGQTQDNLKVEEISENKVRVNYDGEIFELFF